MFNGTLAMLLNASSNAIGQCLIPTDIDTAIDIDTDTYVSVLRLNVVVLSTPWQRKCENHIATRIWPIQTVDNRM